MKKPNITEGNWYHTDDGVFTDAKNHSNIVAEWTRVCDGQAISAVPEMIDALIECHALIDDMYPADRTENHLRLFNQIVNALEKSGVEL